MVANLDCHLDWAQWCLGDQLKTHLEVSVRDFSEKMDVWKISYAVETHPVCSQQSAPFCVLGIWGREFLFAACEMPLYRLTG